MASDKKTSPLKKLSRQPMNRNYFLYYILDILAQTYFFLSICNSKAYLSIIAIFKEFFLNIFFISQETKEQNKKNFKLLS